MPALGLHALPRVCASFLARLPLLNRLTVLCCGRVRRGMVAEGLICGEKAGVDIKSILSVKSL